MSSICKLSLLPSETCGCLSWVLSLFCRKFNDERIEDVSD